NKKLTWLIDGRMWAESVLNNGSTFHYPIQVPPVPATPPSLKGAQPQLAGGRFLIAYDNPTNRRILTLQARKWGMLPRDVEGGRQALELLRQNDPFDLALLDMQMPEMDGMRLAREIRQLHGPEALPTDLLHTMGNVQDSQ